MLQPEHWLSRLATPTKPISFAKANGLRATRHGKLGRNSKDGIKLLWIYVMNCTFGESDVAQHKSIYYTAPDPYPPLAGLISSLIHSLNAAIFLSLPRDGEVTR